MPLHHRHLLLFFLLLPFFFFFIAAISAENLSDYCLETRCGNLTVKYPFYLESTAPSPSQSICGYEGFGINCSTGNPILTLPSDVYLLKNINYDSKKLSLVDTEIGLNPCPAPGHNVSLDPNSTLKWDPVNTHYFFLINCTKNQSPSSNGYPPPTSSEYTLPMINCLSNQYYRSYVLPPEKASVSAQWLPVCNRSVKVPLISGVGSIPDNGGFPMAIKSGFMLDWSQPAHCSGCEATQGCCGRKTSTGQFVCFCNDGLHDKNCDDRCLAAVGSLLTPCLLFFITRSLWISCSRSHAENGCLQFRTPTKVEKFLIDCETLTTTRYTYNDIIRMTSKFKHKLGQGGYGSVYKGWLINGTPVAVKLMEKSYNDGDEFCNEVATIGRIHHVNVVRLLGFCVEGSRRALVYDFMENGSLEKFTDTTVAGHCLLRERLHDIALGIARGIEYLHQGCDQRIIHFDIKPHNILLDHDYTPKISDFGLAKSYSKERSTVTITEGKGTIGYVAPEIFYGNSRHVSHKTDVYSFGMLLIAMIGMKEKIGPTDGASSEAYFPQWIHTTLSNNKRFEGIANGQAEIVRKIATIALWCIQWNPIDRPCMKEVVRMLESSTSSLTMPPNHFYPVVDPPEFQVVDSSSTSECSGLLV
ncbi:rust resistance kinase Lr10-like isoform X5 [Nymphaea colorata]|uniref:rust resistance kinase Lr10-like isoform X5 n=1 Tax=Nymphaea colorata TaxID=210225 RepID=UPI00129D8C90|nr:rust resistance kinase Lr10-like isoform X5 [Nymphaea colorata]